MENERDSQRSKVYAAERATSMWGSERLETVPEIEKWLKSRLALVAIQRRYGQWINKRPIYVGDGHARHNAGGDGRGIYMPTWSRTKLVILHELAHTIVWRRYGSQTAGHGWQFCATYLDLVRFILGAEAGEELKAAFKAGRVRYKEPRRHQAMTAEQKSNQARHMAAMRDRREKVLEPA